MAVRRAMAVTGGVLIVAGLVVLAYVAFQLWGTGVQTRNAQQRLASDLDAQLTTVASVPAGDRARTEVAAAALESLEVGDPVGRLQIPAIGVDYVMLYGVDLGTLRAGPGVFPETSLPGQPGNAAVAGHRATFDAPFNLLDELVPGDEVVATTVQGTFTYRVLPHTNPDDPGGRPRGHYLVAPTAIEILDDKGDDRITLMGCHPRWGSSQRIVVEAALVGTTAPATAVAAAPAAAETGAELLAGPPGSWVAVAGWTAVVVAVAAGAMALAWWSRRAGHRWVAWVVYPAAVSAGAVALFMAFDAFSQLNPVAR
jgi:sortase A